MLIDNCASISDYLIAAKELVGELHVGHARQKTHSTVVSFIKEKKQMTWLLFDLMTSEPAGIDSQKMYRQVG